MTHRPNVRPGTWASHHTSSARHPPVLRQERAVPDVAISPHWWSSTHRATIISIGKGCQLMVNVGDRIRLSSTKGPDRDGVTAVTGSLVRVRWPSEEETTVVPAPGTRTVLATSGASRDTAPTKKAGKKSATATTSTSGNKLRPTTPGRERRLPNDHRADQGAGSRAPGTGQDVRPGPVSGVRCAQPTITVRRSAHRAPDACRQPYRRGHGRSLCPRAYGGRLCCPGWRVGSSATRAARSGHIERLRRC